MKVFYTLFSALFILFSVPLFAYTSANLNDVKFENNADKFNLTFNFNQSLGYEDRPVSVFKNYLHIEFPDAMVRKNKTITYTVNDALVKELIFVQYAKSLMRLRIVLDKEAKDYADLVNVTVKGKTVNVTLDKKTTTEAANTSETTEESAQEEIISPVAAEIKEAEEVTGTPSKNQANSAADITDQKNNIQQLNLNEEPGKKPVNEAAILPFSLDDETDEALEGTKPDYKKFGYSFAAIMTIIGICAVVFKKVTKKGNLPLQAKGMKINVISTQYLGPKRNLSLVNIGDQYFLIGVTPDKISLISQMDKNEVDLNDANFFDKLGKEKETVMNSAKEGLNFNDELKKSLFGKGVASSYNKNKPAKNGGDRLANISAISEMIKDRVNLSSAR